MKKRENLLLKNEERNYFIRRIAISQLFLLFGLILATYNFFIVAGFGRVIPDILNTCFGCVGLGFILIALTLLTSSLNSVQTHVWSTDLLKAAREERKAESIAKQENSKWITETVHVPFEKFVWWKKAIIFLTSLIPFGLIIYGISILAGYFPASDRTLEKYNMSTFTENIFSGTIFILVGILSGIVIRIMFSEFSENTLQKPKDYEEWPDIIDNIKEDGHIH